VWAAQDYDSCNNTSRKSQQQKLSHPDPACIHPHSPIAGNVYNLYQEIMQQYQMWDPEEQNDYFEADNPN
jgi:hypothetical protein